MIKLQLNSAQIQKVSCYLYFSPTQLQMFSLNYLFTFGLSHVHVQFTLVNTCTCILSVQHFGFCLAKRKLAIFTSELHLKLVFSLRCNVPANHESVM